MRHRNRRSKAKHTHGAQPVKSEADSSPTTYTRGEPVVESTPLSHLTPKEPEVLASDSQQEEETTTAPEEASTAPQQEETQPAQDTQQQPEDSQEQQQTSAMEADLSQPEMDTDPTDSEPQPQPEPTLSPAELEEIQRATTRLLQIDEEVSKLERKLRVLPEQIAQYHASVLALYWHEKALAASFSRSAPTAQSAHHFLTTLAARTQHAVTARRSSSQLTYASAGVSETLLHQIFKLDDVHGGGNIRFQRKSIVLRAQALIRQADRVKAGVARFDSLLDKVDQLQTAASAAAARRAPTETKSAPSTAPSSAPKSSPALGSPQKRGRKQMETSLDQERSTKSQAQSQQPRAATPPRVPSPAKHTPPSSSPAESDTDAAQDEEEQQSQPQHHISPAEAARKARLTEFLRLKRSLPRAAIEVDERNTGDAIQIIMNIEGSSRDHLFIDRDTEARRVSVSGLQFSSPAMASPFGFFGFPQPVSRHQPPVPSAWFEKTFEIPATLNMDAMDVAERDSLLILTFPVIARRRSPPLQPRAARAHPQAYPHQQPAPRGFPGHSLGSMFSRPFF